MTKLQWSKQEVPAFIVIHLYRTKTEPKSPKSVFFWSTPILARTINPKPWLTCRRALSIWWICLWTCPITILEVCLFRRFRKTFANRARWHTPCSIGSSITAIFSNIISYKNLLGISKKSKSYAITNNNWMYLSENWLNLAPKNEKLKYNWSIYWLPVIEHLKLIYFHKIN